MIDKDFFSNIDSFETVKQIIRNGKSIAPWDEEILWKLDWLVIIIIDQSDHLIAHGTVYILRS